MFKPDMPHAQADLLASLIEEEDWTASLGETLYQIARRVERQPFSEVGQAARQRDHRPVADGHARHRSGREGRAVACTRPRQAGRRDPALRDRCLRLGAELPWAERGAILTLLGSAERAFYLINRIVDERDSVSREIAQRAEAAKDRPLGGMQTAPCRRDAERSGGEAWPRRRTRASWRMAREIES